MEAEQFEQLLNSIKTIGEDKFCQNLFLQILSTLIAGLIIVYVSRSEVRKSEEQATLQRTEEVKQNKLFMVDKYKLEASQELLNLTAKIDINIINMINLGEKKRNIYEVISKNKLNKQDTDIEEVKEQIHYCYISIQGYLSNMNTVKELFEFKNDEENLSNLINLEIKKFYDFCSNDKNYDKKKLKKMVRVVWI